MESGELETRKIFEETTTKNVQTGISFTQDTRKLFRELEEKVLLLESIVRQQQETINEFRMSLSVVQMRLFSGGTE